ncbi:uncharacterized protein N7477_000419 [Penicillium maclennaniae]|uniref:uncharacterized protein n=1 Tax=Penicillium maclennaniae TaxID=1343394 RepID=UPI00253FED27|nr:uncharacterized protein N7477_000419 [Penicillium maclennaniae]KAJ5684074.1 hypothetical protein N7477_000419 [Penicillium maclennaniae]
MGLLRDAIGSALGDHQVNNGLSGPKLPFGSKNNIRDSARLSSAAYRQSPSPSQGYPSYMKYGDGKDSSSNDIQGRTRSPPGPMRPTDLDGRSFRRDNPVMGYQASVVDPPLDRMQQWYNEDRTQYSDLPPCYESPASDRRDRYQGQSDALPQIAYGDEQPFLRGYTRELGQYGISEQEFIGLLDAINVAIIPNPENQIFQKGANIAGWFLPGAAGIGLAVGQVGVGLGTAVGHASAVNQVLSSANLQLFLPRGLEICIGKTDDVGAEVGLVSGSRRSNSYGFSPEERRASFGNRIAPLSRVLPPLQQTGRNDPIAQLGRGLASRTNQKKMQKADKEMTEGKTKNINTLEGGLKWLIIRQASADALAYWRNSAAGSVAHAHA